MCVRWENIAPSSFGVSNDVKLGGKLPPIVFNVYMDSFSTPLNCTNIGGGHIVGQLLNQLCYADDFCIVSMSSSGMQRM